MAIKSIYDIEFKNFGDIDIDKMLTILAETYNKDVSFRMQLKRYKNSRWYDRYEYVYSQSKNNEKIAFYSDYYYRDDHITIFKNFINEFSYFDYVLPVKLPKERFNLKRGCKMIKWDIYNLWKLKRVKMDLKKRLYYLRVLGLISFYRENMEKYFSIKKYTYGMVYNDSNPYENMLVQVMKKRSIYTSTMQHGIFDKRGYFKGLEYRTSVADDWLAWNAFSKELAMECEVPEKKIKILGIPRYIKPIALEKKERKGVIGIVLGIKALVEENQKLIEFANMISKENNLKYFLRYHPTCQRNEYDRFIDKDVYIDRTGIKETVNQMCEQSDFCLIGSGTSMIIDLIYLKQPFLQYFEQYKGGEYFGRNNYFRNFNELNMQVKNQGMFISEDVFYYYCTTKDVKQSYDKYFSTL